MVRRSRLAALAVLATVVAGTTACQPPPPRLVLTVTTTANGTDDTPGDGVCASAAAAGECTLQAAFDEGNEAPHGADLVVPAGWYGGFDPTVTGDIRLNWDAPKAVRFLNGVHLTVALGGRSAIDGVLGSSTFPFAAPLTVAGTAVVRRSLVGRLTVGDGGVLVMDGSIALSLGLEQEAEIQNRGIVLARSSTLLAHNLDYSTSRTVLDTSAGSQSHLAASVLARPDLRLSGTIIYAGGSGACSGAAPVSHGFVHIEVACGGTPAAGDGSGDADYYLDGRVSTIGLGIGSPLVDAIPLGDPACDVSTTDLFGRPRGVDGNGDGVGGCDIGAVERQPGDIF